MTEKTEESNIRRYVNINGPAIIGIALGLVFSISCMEPVFGDMLQDVSAGIKRTLLAQDNQQTLIPEAQTAGSESLIAEIYRVRDFLPIWIENQQISDQARLFIRFIQESEQDGLIPEDYHLSAIQELLFSINMPQSPTGEHPIQQLIDLDILLTDALYRYSYHMAKGRVDPETVDSLWLSLKPFENINDLIGHALYTRTLEETLYRLKPTHPGYYRLREALQHYRDIQKNGGWPVIPDGGFIRPEDINDRIPLIRKRLAITGDIQASNNALSKTHDTGLVHAIKRFQYRHGIDPDGIIGPQTLREMNIPVTDRIRQIEMNLERWRWLSHDFGQKYILVNIADYSLTAMNGSDPVLSMRVVVGQAYRRTPVFSERMRYLVINPDWNIPEKIAIEDKLPIIKKNPDYLIRQNIHVYSGWDENALAINPHTIDWSRINAGYFPYRLKQKPGTQNALGRIKFMFPNRFAVYLHDTPQRNLFKRTSRGFSSGCIRIEKPVDLAAYVLSGNSEWTVEKIIKTIDSGKTKVIPIRDSIMVHLLYWTVWVDEGGIVNFRDDIYDRDRPLWEAIETARSLPAGAGKISLNTTIFPTSSEYLRHRYAQTDHRGSIRRHRLSG
jgi:murein L,D-transpeptidase YcbB/YkuD